MATSPAILSYNHNDLGLVSGLVDELQGFGVAVWWDKLGVSPGDSWRERFETATKGCTETIYALVLSGRDGLGDSQKDEISFLLGKRNQIHVIPVVMTGGQKSVFDIVGLAGKHVADLSATNSDRSRVLEQLLQKLLGDAFFAEMRRLAIFQPVRLRPKSCYVAISNPLAGAEWYDFRHLLQDRGFVVVEDTDPKPDAFSAEARLAILSTSLVLLDGRIDRQTKNIHPDVAYALGLARAYHKRIVVLISHGSTVVDRESVHAVIESDELTPEIVVQLANSVVEAYGKLTPPYLSAGTDGAMAISFNDINLCPRLRADVLHLIESYQWYWQALERISQGLNLLLGPVELAASEECNLYSQDIVTRIGLRFSSDFKNQLGSDFSKITNIAGKVTEYEKEASRIIERIQGRAGKGSSADASKARGFLRLFFVHVSRLQQCHQHCMESLSAGELVGEVFHLGPVWWQNQIKTQLTYIREARGFMEQFFNSLMQFLKPQQMDMYDVEVANSAAAPIPGATAATANP